MGSYKQVYKSSHVGSIYSYPKTNPGSPPPRRTRHCFLGGSWVAISGVISRVSIVIKL